MKNFHKQKGIFYLEVNNFFQPFIMTGKKMAAKSKPALKFQRNVGESKKDYLNRIDQEAALAIADSMKESRELRQSRKR